MSFNILVTGAGAPGSRGTIYSLKELKNINKIIGVDCQESKIAKALFDKFHRIPEPTKKNYIASLLEICLSEEVSLILPQTTREIEVLSSQKERFEEKGLKVAVSNFKSIKLANDKMEVTKACQSLGFSVPKIKEVSSLDQLLNNLGDFGFPSERVVIKAKNLNGKRGYRIISKESFSFERFLKEKPSADEIDLEEIKKHLPSKFEEIMLMEYLPGKEYSVDAFIGKKHKIAIPRIRKKIRSGISFSNSLEKNEMLINQTLKLGELLGLEGVFGVQFKEDKNGTYKVLECNPRVQGTMVVSSLAGANIIRMSIEELVLNKFDHDYNIDWDTKFERFWGGYGIRKGEFLEI